MDETRTSNREGKKTAAFKTNCTHMSFNAVCAARPAAMKLVQEMAQSVQHRNADRYSSAAERYVPSPGKFV